MRTSGVSFKLVLLLILCAACPLQAKVLTARIAQLKTGVGTLQAVTLRLDWPEGAPSGSLRLQAGKLDFPSLSYQARNLDWRCPLLRAADGGWRCDGPLRAAGSGIERLAVNFSQREASAELAVGSSHLGYRRVAAQPDRNSVRLDRVPVGWLKDFLAGLWAQGRWNAGALDGSVDILTPKAGPFEVRTDLHLGGVGLETPDGAVAASALNGQLKLDYRESGGGQRVDANFVAHGGEILVDRFYAALPASPVSVHVLAQRSANAPWQLPRIEWRDPGVLSADGSAVLDPGNAVKDLDLNLSLDSLALARDRYLSGFLGPAGFPDLVLAGKLDATLQLRAAQLSAMQARFGAVNAVDTKARFTFAGIDGSLRWTASAAPQTSELSWTSGAIFGIGLGSARFPFSSSNSELRLGQKVSIEALQGRIMLDHLKWQASGKDTGAKFQFGMTMASLDLGSLSQRLGWPAFTGSVDGRIPSARFQNDILAFDGGLQMKLFGGSIELADLSMERPFGVAPTLTGDVLIQDIDLEPMTRVFGFGSITGRLDGHISQLRLVDWAPVAFDAKLETDRAFKGKRRISQRAVKDISNVGGSGIAGGLQTTALKMFNDFAYDRIGLGCKLKDNICTMDGIGSAGDGYIIVAGAGLPRIQVVGFRRQVDWSTLVARLKAATQGQAPVIQ